MSLRTRLLKIYDTDQNLIGKGDQTRGNLFYLDMDEATCLVVAFDDVVMAQKVMSC